MTAHTAAVGTCGWYVEYDWDGFGTVDFTIASNNSIKDGILTLFSIGLLSYLLI